MITYGDFHAWCTQELHRNLEKVINANQFRRKPYYLLVIINNGYEGPPAGNRNVIRPTKTMDLSGKKVMRCVINIIDEPPLMKLIGSLLWRVDNRIGLAQCLYALPPDKPTIGEAGECISDLVSESAQNMPIRDYS